MGWVIGPTGTGAPITIIGRGMLTLGIGITIRGTIHGIGDTIAGDITADVGEWTNIRLRFFPVSSGLLSSA